MQKKIIKLTKTETNELLKVIREEEPNYGLILSLQYLYGRNVSEVYNLKKTDINQEEDTITFVMNGDELTYQVHEDIKELLYEVVDTANKMYIFQEGNRPLSNVKDGINYYLHKKTEILKDLTFLEGLRLTTKDFKALRGQHLYIDGVSLKTIHELYHNTNTEGTKKTINYEGLKQEYDKEDVMEIINSTCLTIYTEHDFNSNPLFYVTKDDEEAILEVNKDGTFNFYGDEFLKKLFKDIDISKLSRTLKQIQSPGDYTYYNDIKFLRN